jgi:CheY-like chemotaxis protein
MATVLVVDDSAVDRHRVGSLLEKHVGLTAAYATNGQEALAAIEQQVPDVVLSDLRMPGMNGLELVEAIKTIYPSLPVILMTAFGNEDVAILALQRGAASYVPKRNLARQVFDTVGNVLEVTQATYGHQRVLDCLMDTESHFVLGNDQTLIPHLLAHLRNNLTGMKLCNDNEVIRVGMALREALINAIHHGNLEVNSDLLSQGEKAYNDLLAERSRQAPYKDRHVHLTVRYSRSEVAFVVQDDGPGFDPARLPDHTDPANLEKPGERGLLLIRTFMDEVRHNEKGNQLTMIKRRNR